jgi:SAM-dependent methyltransferase
VATFRHIDTAPGSRRTFGGSLQTIEKKWRVAQQVQRRDGVGAVIRLIGRSAADHLMHSAVRRRHADFDRRYGVDTAGVIAATELDHAKSRHGDGAAYMTVSIHQAERMFRAIAASVPKPLGDFTFVDLGCGKGLPLMLAVLGGFGSAIGVELDSGLAETARKNAHALAISAGISGDAIEVADEDAADFEFPERPTVLFMYNPFGEGTLSTVVENAVESVGRRPRPFFVAYYNAVHREVVDAHSALRPVRHTVRWSLYSVEVGA